MINVLIQTTQKIEPLSLLIITAMLIIALTLHGVSSRGGGSIQAPRPKGLEPKTPEPDD